MILTKNHFLFPIGSIVAVQHEDGSQWMKGIMEEMNGPGHQGQSYITRVMKMSRLIRHNIRYICNTPVTTEQYLQEQIKKGTGQLEDIFMEAKSVKQHWVCHTYRHMHCTMAGRRKVCRALPSKESPKGDCMHIVSNGNLDCAMRSETLWNMIIRSTQILTKSEIRNQSGQIICKLRRWELIHNNNEHDLPDHMKSDIILRLHNIREQAKK